MVWETSRAGRPCHAGLHDRTAAWNQAYLMEQHHRLVRLAATGRFTPADLCADFQASWKPAERSAIDKPTPLPVVSHVDVKPVP